MAARHEGDTRVLTKRDGEEKQKQITVKGETDVYLGVLNGSNSPGSQDQLLPGLLQVDDVDAVGLLFEDVLLHRGLAVIRANVGGCSQHLGDVILLKIVFSVTYVLTLSCHGII